jgi:circadian clock protein KaiC
VSHKYVSNFRPSIVVVDPVTNLVSVSTQHEVRSMLTRLVDYLKTQGTTAVFTSLTSGGEPVETAEGQTRVLVVIAPKAAVNERVAALEIFLL